MSIVTSIYFFNKDQHVAIATELNERAASKNVQVSRWVNNSKGRQIVTYIVHTGERNQFASKQEGVLFQTSVDAGRGNRVRDETSMMNEVLAFLNSIVTDTEYSIEMEGTEPMTVSASEAMKMAQSWVSDFNLSADAITQQTVKWLGGFRDAILVDGEVFAVERA